MLTLMYFLTINKTITANTNTAMRITKMAATGKRGIKLPASGGVVEGTGGRVV